MTESQISISELRYRRLFEAARDGILIVDPETRRIIDANPFMSELLGIAHEELLGKELFEIGLLKDEAASQSAFRELQRTGYIRFEDLPLETKAGREVEVEFISNLYQEGDHAVIQCNIRDISARKHAEAALRRSDERFKLVARAVSDVIWDWDLETDLRGWSDGFYSKFGYAESDIEPSNESWLSRIHPEDLDRVVDSVHLSIDNGAESWKAEYRFRCSQGHYLEVLDSGFILRGASGKGVRIVGGLRDLTEQKNMELLRLRSQRMESIGTLSGGIAHDLNNVFTPIQISIDLLKLDASEDSYRNKILDTMGVSCHRGADLVKQVLAFARGADGQRINIRLRHLVIDLERMIRGTFPSNIKILCRMDRELWPVEGDPTQIHQVLLNLAVNARDAMPEGGTLSVEATNVELDDRNVFSHEGRVGRFVLLQVSDTGEGIGSEIRERIFDPFFTTKEVGKGTGLGLATVHFIVKNHGGFVNLESEVGSGSTFSVYLPISEASEVTEVSPPLRTAVERGRGELVLVVDDEPSIRDVTCQILEAYGYCVIVACDGAEAVALYARQGKQIAIVLLDWMMPVMSGPMTVRAIRGINPLAKIVVVSGHERPDNLSDLALQGFLPKPFSGMDLARLFREVIDQSIA